MTKTCWLAWHVWLDFLAEQPMLSCVLVLSIQAILIALAARGLESCCSSDPFWSHSIWLVATVLFLLILPVHTFVGGWTLRVGQREPIDSLHEQTELFNSATNSVRDNELHEAPTVTSQVPSDVNQSPNKLAAAMAIGKDSTESIQHAGSGTLRNSITDNRRRGLSLASKPNADTASVLIDLFVQFATACYVIGVLISLFRLGWGMRYLHRLSSSGLALDGRTLTDFEQSAQQIGLPVAPQIRAVNRLTMPLTFGTAQPVVLVPSDFAKWPEPEQRAVAMHELIHVARRDVLWELLSRIMQAIYWFHPASAFVAKRLRMARELATDRSVLDRGEDARLYAHSLVTILSRACSNERQCIAQEVPAVAISAMGTVEARLQCILRERCTRLSNTRGRMLVGMLLAVAVISTVRLHVASAQPQQPTTTNIISATPTADEKAARQNATTGESQPNYIMPVLPGENDLFARIRDCEVLTVTGDEYHSMFTFSGQVLSADGQSVEGAIVLLRESSTQRISSEPTKYVEIDDGHLVRVQDVFARTVTDREGRFSFDKVKSPALPKHWSNSWAGDVVAGHSKLGIGWMSLWTKKQKQRIDSGVVIRLNPHESITGKHLTPEDRPLVGATVNLYRFERPTDRRSNLGPGFDLQCSQLVPRAVTNASGSFVLSGLPRGFVATVGASEVDDWLGAWALVATSSDVANGTQFSNYFPLPGKIVASPFSMVADAGIMITGSVTDESGIPIAGINVAPSSSWSKVHSNEQGEFSLHLRSILLEMIPMRNAGKLSFYARVPKGSDLLPRYVKVPVEDVRANKPMRITLQRGVKVSGKIVTQDGQGAANILVRQLADFDSAPSGAVTDANGEYEMNLARGQHILVVGTDQPGYHLPTRVDLVTASELESTDWPRKRVDVSDGLPKRLDPFAVSRVSEVEIKVSLPDGQPAIGASVLITDQDALYYNENDPFRFEKPKTINQAPSIFRSKDISETVETDRQGRVRLFTKGSPSPAATAEVQLTTSDSAYHGTAKLTEAKDGVVHIVLRQSWLLEGHVLLDGKPLAGVRISAGESNRITRQVGPQRAAVTVSRVSNNKMAVSDTDGWYRLPVPGDREYSVTIRSIPGYSDVPRIGFGTQKIAEGILRVNSIEFVSGSEEIAGVVMDADGKPLNGARVYAVRSNDCWPDLWLGHQSASKFETDAQGNFHLRKMPKGSYQLRVNGPQIPGMPSSTTIVAATTGDLDLQIIFDRFPKPAVP